MNLVFCNLQGQIITPNDPSYDNARQEWNRAINYYPIAIIYCKTYDDVRESILWARECEVPIRIRSGGHHYEGYSIGNGVVVIDLSAMTSIKLHKQTHTVTIRGGVQNAQLYNVVSKEGYPFPGGICPTVGVTGYCLGGGWGYSARLLGLGCDSLISLELIDYKGCLITANCHTHQELFEACKGAGSGNFGVVVSMTFMLPPKVDKVTGFTFYIPNVSHETALNFLEKWQLFIQTVSPKLNMNAGIYNTLRDGKYIYARGICYDTPRATLLYLETFKTLAGITFDMTYAPFLNIINQFASTYPPYEYFKSSGRFVDRHYTRDVLESFLHLIDGPLPEGSILTSINVYGLGGKIKEVEPTDTAFYYRNAHYILQLQTVWEDNLYKPANIKWFNAYFPTIYSQTIGSFINFPFNDLPCYPIDYYSRNIYWLQKVKRMYDPCNIFCFEQSIPLTSFPLLGKFTSQKI